MFFFFVIWTEVAGLLLLLLPGTFSVSFTKIGCILCLFSLQNAARKNHLLLTADLKLINDLIVSLDTLTQRVVSCADYR
jgi:hypothetical protein